MKDEFSTFNYDFNVVSNSHMTGGTIFAVPGKEFDFSVNIVDQLNNSLTSVYSAAIRPINGSNMFVDPCSVQMCFRSLYESSWQSKFQGDTDP